MVKIGSYLSDQREISFGVPQGSILGPTLFLIYINDLCNMILHNAKIISYADDTAIIFSENTWRAAADAANGGLRRVAKWLQANLLTLNVSKTKYLTFGIKNHLLPTEQLNVRIHNCLSCTNNTSSCSCPALSKSSNIKYLGLFLEQTLNWKEHINLLSGRIRKLIYVFKQLRHSGDATTLQTVYSSLCSSIINYCILAWGGVHKTTLLKLERAQRSVLKTIHFKPYRYPTDLLYKEANTLTVRQIYIFKLIKSQHKLKNRLPNTNVRRKHVIFHTPLHHTNFAQHFSPFLGPYIYNRINKILSISQKNSFELKKIVFKWLHSMDYTETEKQLEILA